MYLVVMTCLFVMLSYLSCFVNSRCGIETSNHLCRTNKSTTSISFRPNLKRIIYSNPMDRQYKAKEIEVGLIRGHANEKMKTNSPFPTFVREKKNICSIYLYNKHENFSLPHLLHHLSFRFL